MFTIHDHMQEEVKTVYTANEAAIFLSRGIFCDELTARGWYIQNVNRISLQLKEAEARPGIGVWDKNYTYCITKDYR